MIKNISFIKVYHAATLLCFKCCWSGFNKKLKHITINVLPGKGHIAKATK